MGKRRHYYSTSSEDDSDKEYVRLKNKIKKLKKKLRRQKKSRHERVQMRTPFTSPEPERESFTPVNLNRWSSTPASDRGTRSSTRSPSIENSEPNLDVNILKLFGDALSKKEETGPAIQTELAERWEEIVKQGLPEGRHKEIIIKYPKPVNCGFLKPPSLNLEIKAAIPETSIKRDEGITIKQEKITACLSAVGLCISKILGKEVKEQHDMLILEALSDTIRLLADMQNVESEVRRSLILSNINASLKDTLRETKIDSFLFGKNLEDLIKNTKLLEKTSKELKKAGKQGVPKNLKTPLRRQVYTPRSGKYSFKGTSYWKKQDQRLQNYQKKPLTDWRQQTNAQGKQTTWRKRN